LAIGNPILRLPFLSYWRIVQAADSDFTMRTVASGLASPHEIVCAPDLNIWVTERTSGTVSLVDPASGLKTVVLTLGSKVVQASTQDGLLGLVLHPDFLASKPYAYIAYSYS
jgi:glucose/arabinose dehydrogenase